mmetsp:Transcript_24734/g.54219  ORF Transcript_24734/g.54219 Transcript_24734/m.54219 type:complete len:241 (+) Transcript_24734:1507-2229(+)
MESTRSSTKPATPTDALASWSSMKRRFAINVESSSPAKSCPLLEPLPNNAARTAKPSVDELACKKTFCVSTSQASHKTLPMNSANDACAAQRSLNSASCAMPPLVKKLAKSAGKCSPSARISTVRTSFSRLSGPASSPVFFTRRSIMPSTAKRPFSSMKHFLVSASPSLIACLTISMTPVSRSASVSLAGGLASASEAAGASRAVASVGLAVPLLVSADAFTAKAPSVLIKCRFILITDS